MRIAKEVSMRLKLPRGMLFVSLFICRDIRFAGVIAKLRWLSTVVLNLALMSDPRRL